MKNLLHPSKDILFPDEVTKTTLVDIPQKNIFDGYKEIYGDGKEKGIIEEYGLQDKIRIRQLNQIGIVDFILTEEDYLKQCNEVIAHYRVHGSVDFKGKVDYGTQHFASIMTYFFNTSETLHNWLYANLVDFKAKILPDLESYLGTEEGMKIVDKHIETMIKKKGQVQEEKELMQWLNNISFDTCKNLLPFIASRISTLLEENSLTFTSFDKPLLKTENKVSKPKDSKND